MIRMSGAKKINNWPILTESQVLSIEASAGLFS